MSQIRLSPPLTLGVEYIVSARKKSNRTGVERSMEVRSQSDYGASKSGSQGKDLSMVVQLFKNSD